MMSIRTEANLRKKGVGYKSEFSKPLGSVHIQIRNKLTSQRLDIIMRKRQRVLVVLVAAAAIVCVAAQFLLDEDDQLPPNKKRSEEMPYMKNNPLYAQRETPFQPLQQRIKIYNLEEELFHP